MILTRSLISAVAFALLGFATPHASAAAKCQLGKVVEFPITMSGLRPTITGKINGVDAQFALDSGAFFSMISSATADQFNLPRKSAPYGLKVRGVGGETETSIATVKVFTIAGIPMQRVEFLVGGSESGAGTVGLLGQNFLIKWDVEYDLAKGVVRLFKADDCQHAMLAYWARPEQSLAMMDIGRTTLLRPHTTGTAYLNGAKITVVFDTGAWTSMLSLKAAARAGITPDTAGVLDAGYSSGIGRSTVKTYIARFSSFKIGDGEEIKNTRLRFADISLDEGDMLLGADFFLSHHIYVANSQHRVYFTYNGGAVFNLGASVSAGKAADSDEAGEAKERGDELADAAAYSRRGAAFAGRRDFEHALADFTRACELNPDNPDYSYQRGMAYWGNKQPAPALADLDHALELDPDYLAARMARAQLRLDISEVSLAAADLEAADRIAPKQADVRFTLAELYARAKLSAAAVAQLDLWILHHPDDSKMTAALTGRCRERALQGQDLAKALTDCNAALRSTAKSSPAAASILDSRGLVRLRMGDYDKSIADYDASLKPAPKNPWGLYGRGVAKSRAKHSAAAEADIAGAMNLWPQIADEFKQRGITP